jgi:hypothetical protein
MLIFIGSVYHPTQRPVSSAHMSNGNGIEATLASFPFQDFLGMELTGNEPGTSVACLTLGE